MTIVHGIDISNWQGADIQSLLNEHQPEHVVVRLSKESNAKLLIALRQLQQVAARSISYSVYLWCYWDSYPESFVDGCLQNLENNELRPTMLWLDCEDTDNLPPEKCDDWLSRAVAAIEDGGYRAGIYTGKYWWEPNVADHAAFARLPLWLAHYDRQPTLESSILPVGAWTELAGKQYTDSPIDQDVFTVAVTTHPPAPDPCAGLRAAIIKELERPRLNRKRLAALVGV